MQLKQLSGELEALEKSEQKAAGKKQKELHALQNQIAALRPELPLKSYNATGAVITDQRVEQGRNRCGGACAARGGVQAAPSH